jgi:predicted ATPase
MNTHEVPLQSLRVAGLTSLADAHLALTSPVTLLVGPNGAGKSNVVDAFELLGRIVDGQLNDYVLQRGGFGALLHRAADPAATPDQIRLNVWGEEKDQKANGYEVKVRLGADESALVDETMYFQDAGRGYDKPYTEGLGLSAESKLRALAGSKPFARYVLDVVAGCRVFHFDDTSPDAPPKRLVDDADNITLAPDARNIAAVLRRLRDVDPSRYRRIVRTVRTVAPYFDDFVVEPERAGQIRLRWRERRLDGVFSADTLSDGTLRFICLTVLLLQDSAPRTIVLDEPELGLHPFAIHQLASLMQKAASGRRVIAATQSVTLLEQFTVQEVAIVERGQVGTMIRRPDPRGLEQWLEEYSLGELWEKNLLGGQPGPDDRPRVVGA